MKTSHLVEKINIYNQKVQGNFFEISDPAKFAQIRCAELNANENSVKYNHNYIFKINPDKTECMPVELYVTTEISKSKGIAPVTIAIYRKFK
mgnify:CR=1 FL=1